MYISLTTSSTNGFKRWSDTHRPDDDDDFSGGVAPIAITEPPCDDIEAHSPWLVPGTGSSF